MNGLKLRRLRARVAALEEEMDEKLTEFDERLRELEAAIDKRVALVSAIGFELCESEEFDEDASEYEMGGGDHENES